MSKDRLWLLWLVGAANFCSASEVDDLFNLSLNDLSNVKVSVASLRLESVAEAPSTVNLITPTQWQSKGASTVAEAVSDLPGIWVTPANYGGQAVNMRGFFPSYRGVSTLLDGITVNSFLDSSAFEDYRRWQLGALSQIEVIRGPGSSLYGADALRGVIALSSWAKPATDAKTEQLRASYADSGRRDLQFHAGGDWLSGSLQFALAGQQQPAQYDTYRYSEPATNALKTGEYRNELSNHMAVLGWNGNIGRANTEISFYSARDFAENTPGLGTSLSRGVSVFKDRDFSSQDRHFSM
ncbi:MAG TPA: TonB-dependent receptor plug domain-containing protein, partial [Pseudomonadales bacterium]|nr:TonB-dependent receptor plug domain-containing protein [Pseudomonadales bacterium]